MKTITVAMAFERSTKNTHRFLELETESPIIRTLYVQKDDMAEPPSQIVVTIAAAKNGRK